MFKQLLSTSTIDKKYMEKIEKNVHMNIGAYTVELRVLISNHRFSI